MPEETDIVVKVSAQITELQKGLNQIQKDLGTTATKGKKDLDNLGGGFKNLNSSIKGVVTGFASLYVVSKVSEFLKDSIKKAAEEAVVMNQLRVATDNAGIGWDNNKDSINSFLKGMQATTAFADDEMAGSLRTLIAMTGDLSKSEKGAKIAADMAASGQFELTQATRLVGMAINGNVEMLGRMIPELKMSSGEISKNATQSEKAAFALELLNKKFGGQAQAGLNTYAGKVKQMRNNFDDLKEDIGNELIPVLSNLTQQWNAIFAIRQQGKEAVLNEAMIKDYAAIEASVKLYNETTDKKIKLTAKDMELMRNALQFWGLSGQEILKASDILKIYNTAQDEATWNKIKSNEASKVGIPLTQAEIDELTKLNIELRKYNEEFELKNTIKQTEYDMDKRMRSIRGGVTISQQINEATEAGDIKEQGIIEDTKLWGDTWLDVADNIQNVESSLTDMFATISSGDAKLSDIILSISSVLGVIPGMQGVGAGGGVAGGFLKMIGMARGGEFTGNFQPLSTIRAANGLELTKSTMINAGERGHEGIIPLDPFWNKMDEGFASFRNDLKSFSDVPNISKVINNSIFTNNTGKSDSEGIARMLSQLDKTITYMARQGTNNKGQNININMSGLVSLTNPNTQDQLMKVGISPAEKRLSKRRL